MKDELTFTQFERMCEKYPDRPAIIYLGEKFTYTRLRNLIDRFATALNRLGVRKGDKVMLYITNSAQWVICFLRNSKDRGCGGSGGSHLHLFRNRIYDQ